MIHTSSLLVTAFCFDVLPFLLLDMESGRNLRLTKLNRIHLHNFRVGYKATFASLLMDIDIGIRWKQVQK
jgi:hypothetical protein